MRPAEACSINPMVDSLVLNIMVEDLVMMMEAETTAQKQTQWQEKWFR